MESFKYFMNLPLIFPLFDHQTNYDIPLGDHNIIAFPMLWRYARKIKKRDALGNVKEVFKTLQLLWSKSLV